MKDLIEQLKKNMKIKIL